MKKQKLAVCVLSAALMIGAATLTSYAAEGWQQSGNSWIYVDNNGNKVTNTWKKGADNLWRYLDSQGNIASNCWVDDEYFVESTGIMATDKWLKLPKRNPAWNETSATTVWYYFSTSGKMVSDGWSKIGGKYYYFDGDGAMQTGWVDDDTYYTNADGVMQIGWAYLEDPDDTKKDDDEVKPAKIATRGGGQSNSVAEAPKPSTSTAHSTAPTSVKSKAPIEEIGKSSLL